jgi:nicotinate-nucleotide adenylyltransferase
MRVGLFGGTFDPVHLGHLRAAETAREALGLEQVAFVPSAVPPHRPGPLSAAADRLAMARLATASHPAFEAWDLELRRPGPSYTVDTVAALVAAPGRLRAAGGRRHLAGDDPVAPAGAAVLAGGGGGR